MSVIILNSNHKKIKVILELKASNQNIVNFSFKTDIYPERIYPKIFSYKVNDLLQEIVLDVDNCKYNLFEIQTNNNTLFIKKFIVTGY